ncbi:hypothetical protein RBSH_02111 [Rhodopirellula baltica SH28]|uniref:Uncharacterized protein n=1 Tax=Rhodopirellula baltica SH28 TaxID=993517 RepID=K5D6W3_RHOBT|nr:hypothetical protein RBSH_02111 [Rhodopirellula baltica SH28]
MSHKIRNSLSSFWPNGGSTQLVRGDNAPPNQQQQTLLELHR